jgi:RimJ/RimL family protein N-acetyltransferase
VAHYEEVSITLTPVTDEILEQLVAAATTDAAADEVTPALSPGTQWTMDRIEWLRNYHRSNQTGPDGPGHEWTWAVIRSGVVCGSVRLKAKGTTGIFETGIWLTKDVRGHGVGRGAMAAVIKNAAVQGARELSADTAAGNFGALSLLAHLGFQLAPADAAGRVQARVVLDPKDCLS